MAVMVRGTLPVQTTRAGIKKVYFNELSQLPTLYDKVANVSTSDRGFEDYIKTSGFGRMSVIDEGESVPYDDIVEGSRVVVAHTMYALGYQVSRLLFDDELYGTVKRMTEALARSVRYEQEVQFWALFNDADAGASFTGFDGLPLIDESHTLLKASATTFDNRLAADLSASSLQSAVDIFATMVDDSNMNVALEPRMLVVPAQNRWTAAKLIESQYDPESAENAINPLADVGLSWFATPFITDTDSFFLLSDKSNHDLKFVWRLKPETEDTTDFDTKSLKFSVIQRFSINFNEWRGVVGSMGV